MTCDARYAGRVFDVLARAEHVFRFLHATLRLFSFLVKQAVELLSRMVELRMRPNTNCFNSVISALADANQIDEVSYFSPVCEIPEALGVRGGVG